MLFASTKRLKEIADTASNYADLRMKITGDAESNKVNAEDLFALIKVSDQMFEKDLAFCLESLQKSMDDVLNQLKIIKAVIDAPDASALDKARTACLEHLVKMADESTKNGLQNALLSRKGDDSKMPPLPETIPDIDGA